MDDPGGEVMVFPPDVGLLVLVVVATLVGSFEVVLDREFDFVEEEDVEMIETLVVLGLVPLFVDELKRLKMLEVAVLRVLI